MQTSQQPADFFDHCPRCGRDRTGPGGVSPFECGACGFAYYFGPSVGAVGWVRRGDGRMLFVVRAREPGKGRLAPPGGFVERGERAEDALRRELREEVGLEIGEPRFFGSFTNEYLYRGVVYPVLDLGFVADALNPEQAKALDDAQAVVWRNPFTELDPAELAFDSMRRALEVLRQGIP